MVNKIIAKYRETINYLIFGVINIVFGLLLLYILNLYFMDLIANFISTVLSVILAYFTNNYFVFKTKIEINSFIKFMLMRVFSIVFDSIAMWILLSANFPLFASKLAVMTINTISNYIISKRFIFRKN